MERPLRKSCSIRSRCISAMLASGLLAGSTPLMAQEMSAYRDAVRLVEAGSWKSAVAGLRQVIEADPRARKRAMAKDYVPHYYLGVALFELRDCGGAIASFDESLRQGVISGSKLEPDLIRRKGLCNTRLRAQAEIEAADATARRLSGLRDGSLKGARFWTEGSPTPLSRHSSAVQSLQNARDLLASPTSWTNASLADGALKQAMTAKQQLEAVMNIANERAAAIERVLQEKRDTLQGLMARSTKRLNALQVEDPGRRMSAARRDLLDLIGSVERGGSGYDARTLDGMISRFKNALAELEEAALVPEAEPREVPAELVRAAEGFFSAGYGSVVDQLAGVSFEDRKAAAHAILLRSAARFSLFVLGGESDADLLAQARIDVNEFRQHEASFSPPPEFFSPRFLEFLADPEAVEVRAPASDEESATALPSSLGGESEE